MIWRLLIVCTPLRACIIQRRPNQNRCKHKCRQIATDNQTPPAVSSLFVDSKKVAQQKKKLNCNSCRCWQHFLRPCPGTLRHRCNFSLEIEHSAAAVVCSFPAITLGSLLHVGWGGGGSTTCTARDDASRVTYRRRRANSCMRRLGNRRMHALVTTLENADAILGKDWHPWPTCVEGCVSRGKDSDPHSSNNASLENWQINYQTDVIANLLRVSFTPASGKFACTLLFEME